MGNFGELTEEEKNVMWDLFGQLAKLEQLREGCVANLASARSCMSRDRFNILKSLEEKGLIALKNLEKSLIVITNEGVEIMKQLNG